MKTEASVKTKMSPLQSCFVDGVQFSTGCTMGKGNIFLQEGEGLLATFKKNGEVLTLRLKKEIIDEMSSLPDSEEARESYAKDLLKRKIDNIFEIAKK